MTNATKDLPPTYRLNWLTLEGKERIEPRFPVQVFPQAGSMVTFKFWGADRYDYHNAWGEKWGEWLRHVLIRSVNYQIIYGGSATHFEHPFKSAVRLTLTGMASHTKVICKPYRSLIDMPRLPHDWCYFQFIN